MYNAKLNLGNTQYKYKKLYTKSYINTILFKKTRLEIKKILN